MSKTPKAATPSKVTPFELPVELALARAVIEVPPEAPQRWFEPKLDSWRVCLRTGPRAADSAATDPTCCRPDRRSVP
ncbi:hypothetical protein [Kitasatospora sp. NPDC050463]|uniref:hypothetical protein n=1 Tax=Kitasatospora sp. NPDC050463 TaxID=3155786 RepID=UPI0033E87400